MRPVILLLVVLSVYDASGQADPDDGGKVDYAGDYAGKDDTADKARDVDAPDVSADVSDSRSVKAHHKHSKRHKYWKATVEFLKKTLNPNTLMQNAWFTEMLRKFSHSEDSPEENSQSEESEEIHTMVPTRRRRGRPKKRLHAASLEMAGIRGMLRKGLDKITKIDKKKIKKKIRLMKKMAKKAKRPLKSVVKFYLSSKNNNNGFGTNNAYGGGNNY